MSRIVDNIGFNFIELIDDPKTVEEMISGQKNALRQIGASDVVLTREDLVATPRTYAVVAKNLEGQAIGGVRIHSRLGTRKLPIESDSSPVTHAFRKKIELEPDVCELRGLWADLTLSKISISKLLVSNALTACYDLKFKSVIALAHLRSYRFVVAPLGFELDTRIPPMPYPDERFESMVVWHRGHSVALTKNRDPELRME